MLAHNCPHYKMSRQYKIRNGKKYAYDVKWNKEKQKQEWTYVGSVIENKNIVINNKKLKEDLYKILEFKKLAKNRIYELNYKDGKEMWKRISNLIDDSFKKE